MDLENACYLYSACSNLTDVVQVSVLVIALVIMHQSTLAVSISSTLAYYHTQDNRDSKHLQDLLRLRKGYCPIHTIHNQSALFVENTDVTKPLEN